jgi:hypothetical protein
MIDFRRLCSVVARLAGGVWLDLGDTAALSQTFLEAVAVVRNFGHSLDGLTVVYFDPEPSRYAGRQALARCASQAVGLCGLPEIVLPLLHAAVAARLDRVRPLQPAQAA